MTQTVEQRARELLARQYEGTEYAKVLRKGKSNKYLDGSDIKALAALTEALTRVEELERAVRFYAEEKNWRSPSSGFALQYDPEPSPIKKDWGTIARTTLSKGITE